MHHDERRDPQHIKQQIAANVAANAERTYEQLQAARAGEKKWRSQAATLRKELDRQVKKTGQIGRSERELQRQKKELEAENRRLRTNNRQLTAVRDAARKELAEARTENERLATRVVKLQNSRSFRLGHAVLAPMATVRRTMVNGIGEPRSVVQLAGPKALPAAAQPVGAATPLERSSQPGPTEQIQEQPVSEVPPAPAPSRKLSELSLDELMERFEEERTSGLLAACVNRLWYQHGAIDRTADLIAEHRALVADMTHEQQQLVERVRGTAALRSGVAQLVPPRSAAPAYVAERRRVLYCAYSTPIYHSNGYSVRTQGIVSGMRQAGMDVSVVARAGYPWDIATEAEKPKRRRWVNRLDGVEYTHMPEGALGTDAPDDYVLIAADAYVREARLRRPSVLHAASNYVNGLAALIAARRLGIPFVYEVRGLWEVTEASAKDHWTTTDRFAAQSEMEAFVCREADTVLAITQEVKDELVRRGVDAAKIELLPNGVDPRAIQPLPVDVAHRKTLGIREDVPVIGFAGSLIGYEGLDVLLGAARVLRDRGIRFQVAIAGNGGVLAELKKYQETHGLHEEVRFLGRRPSGEMPRVLSCFDIVCCPRKSLPVTEMVSPLKPLEAFAASKPVVLSDVSPHRTIVGEHCERGLLASPDDPEALADVLQQLIEDPERRAVMGRAGRLWTVDERNWAALGETTRAVYTSISTTEAETSSRPLSSLRIGLIADEFTTETLRRSATIVPLDGERFEEQLRTEELDFVFLESAWNGNGGQWHRSVGYYSDEEDARIARLFTVCRSLKLPTVFWNKEDPVHFERFKRTVGRCDHVFTTDANMIGPYLATARRVSGGCAVTASSLPFYAQPAIHNPLPGARPVESTVAYAGTYYGDRYKDRSAQLSKLLHAARRHGLAVYDRQLALPDSPYQFPREFQGDVRGALPYDEVIDSYKAHTANLNVNSVAESPTMFSRRVVEIAACGGVVLSAWGRGVSETFDGLVPSTNNEDYWEALLGSWSTDRRERLAEAWLQMRAVYRSHTVESALTILARTAGIAVEGLRLPSYGLELDPADAAAVETVVSQSVLPEAVILAGPDPDGITSRRLEAAGVTRVLIPGEPRPEDVAWWGRARAGASRTWAEDLLTGTRYGDWDRLFSRPLRDGETGQPFALPVADAAQAGVDGGNGLFRADLLSAHGGELDAAATSGRLNGLLLITPETPARLPDRQFSAEARSLAGLGTVLVAGHDLKFARAWIDHLEVQGVTVLLDEWADHAHHDEERSRELLAQADTVFCEWGLGNAVWYSQNVHPGQRLVVRVHAQELRRPYLRRIDHSKVSAYVFVGELMRDAAVRSHGVPRAKTVVVPNFVLGEALDRPKEPGAEHVLGMVGMVPQIKRIDLAAELLERLLERDDRFRLRVKGKRPEDYAWMAEREDEMAFYRAAYDRIDRLNRDLGAKAVVFDGHGDDMPQWYQGVGTAISLSDLESFHLTLPDGAVSGAAPVSLAWPGADLIYPREWLVPSVSAMADRIAALAEEPARREAFVTTARQHAREAFDRSTVFEQLDDLLSGHPLPGSRTL